MNWQICMGFCFLVVISVTLWGAAQGWFSRKVVIAPSANTVESTPESECEDLRKKIATLEGMNFSMTNQITEKNATISELNSKLQQLMNAINDLSIKLQNSESNNAKLTEALKNATDDLARCRKELLECRAQLLAKKIADEKCKMTPETSNRLLR